MLRVASLAPNSLIKERRSEDFSLFFSREYMVNSYFYMLSI